MTLNHVHLGTKNLTKSIEFYSSVFNFKKKFDHEPGVFLENSEGFLLAIDPVEDLPELPSWYHLGFCLSSEKEALDIYKKCRALKVNIVREILQEENQSVSFYIADPDGYKLEVSWHNE